MLGHVTHNSAKRMSHQKVGMSKVAYRRMLVGGLDVVKRRVFTYVVGGAGGNERHLLFVARYV